MENSLTYSVFGIVSKVVISNVSLIFTFLYVSLSTGIVFSVVFFLSLCVYDISKVSVYFGSLLFLKNVDESVTFLSITIPCFAFFIILSLYSVSALYLIANVVNTNAKEHIMICIITLIILSFLYMWNYLRANNASLLCSITQWLHCHKQARDFSHEPLTRNALSNLAKLQFWLLVSGTFYPEPHESR